MTHFALVFLLLLLFVRQEFWSGRKDFNKFDHVKIAEHNALWLQSYSVTSQDANRGKIRFNEQIWLQRHVFEKMSSMWRETVSNLFEYLTNA